MITIPVIAPHTRTAECLEMFPGLFMTDVYLANYKTTGFHLYCDLWEKGSRNYHWRIVAHIGISWVYSSYVDKLQLKLSLFKFGVVPQNLLFILSRNSPIKVSHCQISHDLQSGRHLVIFGLMHFMITWHDGYHFLKFRKKLGRILKNQCSDC